jgi:hypothetical protein
MDSKAWRIASGFVAAPIVPCIGGAIVMSYSTPEHIWQFAELMIFVSWFISLFVAVPTYLILQRSAYVSLQKSLLAGFLIGCLISLIMVLLPRDPHDYVGGTGGPIMIGGHWTARGWAQVLEGCLEVGALGAAISLFFWVIACWKLPSHRMVR